MNEPEIHRRLASEMRAIANADYTVSEPDSEIECPGCLKFSVMHTYYCLACMERIAAALERSAEQGEKQ